MKEKIKLSTWVVIWIAILFIIGAGMFWIIENVIYSNASRQQISATSTQSDEISNLQQQITDLKNKTPEVKTETVVVESQFDYSSIIAEWQDRIARIECTWTTPRGVEIQGNQASGILVDIEGLGVTAVTNQHVVRGDINGDYVANWCAVGVYGKGARIVEFAENNSPFVMGGYRDWAYIKLGDGYRSVDTPPNNDMGNFDTITSEHLKVCEGIVNIGDKLVILGYPSIGTRGGITATEGIVSGIEGDYYVTSAKIDHGNSGGAAILLKDNCYLGIPTWAQSGTVESLGRILKSSFALGN
jgi:hypothetical protein